MRAEQILFTCVLAALGAVHGPPRLLAMMLGLAL
jgi:hypothetical protein